MSASGLHCCLKNDFINSYKEFSEKGTLDIRKGTVFPKDKNPKKPHKFPHDHPWDWNQKVPRLKYDEDRDINTDYC